MSDAWMLPGLMNYEHWHECRHNWPKDLPPYEECVDALLHDRPLTVSCGPIKQAVHPKDLLVSREGGYAVTWQNHWGEWPGEGPQPEAFLLTTPPVELPEVKVGTHVPYALDHHAWPLSGPLWTPPPRTPAEIARDEIGNKAAARLALADRTPRVVPNTVEEFHGLSALERDDELPRTRDKETER